MTLGEAKNKVYMLLDEHSAGGEVEHDEDIEKKMTAFFDTAQKTLAQIRRIVREYALPLAMGKTAYEMPSDFSALYRVWADGRITRALRWRAGKLLVPEGYAADIVVEYFAVPNTIPQDAPDSCEFEIDAEACECMPYYVAAQQLLPDLVLDYGAMLQMYDRAVRRQSRRGLFDRPVACGELPQPALHEHRGGRRRYAAETARLPDGTEPGRHRVRALRRGVRRNGEAPCPRRNEALCLGGRRNARGASLRSAPPQEPGGFSRRKALDRHRRRVLLL